MTETLITIQEMRQLSSAWHRDQLQIGFVPTMGALHEGHLKLVELAKERCQKVVVSIFVNPLQFGPKEDFARYPRTLRDDLEKLERVGCDAVFAPSSVEMYPTGFQTNLHNKQMSKTLCGPFRPGHFDGVLTVVSKLFHIVTPDIALFGKKDYQQWRIIQRMVLDLSLPIEVQGCDTLRETDGLAMSSRNRYLSSEERPKAALIYKGLSICQQSWKKGERSTEKILELFKTTLLECEQMKIQYAELVDRDTLELTGPQLPEQNLLMAVSVLYGDVRLIDNLEF